MAGILSFAACFNIKTGMNWTAKNEGMWRSHHDINGNALNHLNSRRFARHRAGVTLNAGGASQHMAFHPSHCFTLQLISRLHWRRHSLTAYTFLLVKSWTSEVAPNLQAAWPLDSDIPELQAPEGQSYSNGSWSTRCKTPEFWLGTNKKCAFPTNNVNVARNDGCFSNWHVPFETACAKQSQTSNWEPSHLSFSLFPVLKDEFDDVQQVDGETCTGNCSTKEKFFS